MPFVKLDTGILDSSLWSEASSTRICWITLLAMADCTGLVKSTAPGIAKRANLGTDETAKALEIFESPDEYSRSLNDQGKKIKRVDGGYQIINYQKYRDYDYTAAERMRRFRELRRNGRNEPNKTVTLRKQKQSTEAEKQKAEEIYQAFPLKVGKPQAIKAISRALSRCAFEDLLSKTKAFATARNGDTAFCPNPSTWFNQERYNDDPSTWSRSSENGRVVRPKEGKDPYEPMSDKLWQLKHGES